MSVARIKFTLGKRLTLLIVGLALALNVAVVAASCVIYKHSTEWSYIELGKSLARAGAVIIDGDAMEGYLETGVMDEAGERTLKTLQALGDGVAGLSYHAVTADEGRLEPGESGYRELGEKSENPPGAWRRAPEGEKFGRIASDPLRGNLFSIYEPVRGSDGSVKGYVAVDFSERELLRERMSHLALLSAVTLSVTTGFCSLYLFVVRKSIVAPINKLTQAADEFLANGERYWKSDSSSISAMEICTGDELQRLCEAMKSVDGKIREYLRDLNMVRERADTDNLTLLHNRDSFQRKVDQYLGGEREESQMDAFMMIDIDFFKVVNDSYGHVVGDEVLIKCAQALRNVLRDTDVVARHGGDEFVVFCKGIGSQSVAENKARQISEAWRNIRPNDGARPVTASIGIAFSPRDGTTFRELYNNADVALYRAKHGGRDRYVLFENREIAKTG